MVGEGERNEALTAKGAAALHNRKSAKQTAVVGLKEQYKAAISVRGSDGLDPRGQVEGGRVGVRRDNFQPSRVVRRTAHQMRPDDCHPG